MKKKVFLFFAFLLGSSVFVSAETVIEIERIPCEIHIIMNKQFYVKGSVSIANWLNNLDRQLRDLQDRLNNATTDAARDQARKDLNFFTRQRQDLTNINRLNTPLTTEELRELVTGWKAQIENKWNLPYYNYDCCKVIVEVNTLVREEAETPASGYDQIGVVSGDFRSYIEGLKNFDSTGFSSTPYHEDLSGVWSSNLIEGYTASHEAGHEMGLSDQYEDPPEGGPSRPLPGRENDLLGGNGTPEQLRNLKVVEISPTGEVLIDNLGTILRGRFVRCRRVCCEALIPGKRRPTGGIAIDTTRRPPDTHSYGESGTASVSTDTTPKPTDAQPAGPSIEAARPKETGASGETGKPAETEPSGTPRQAGETIQYRKVKVNDVTSDTGVLIKDTPAGSQVEISSLPTGKGANFRNWKVDKITLNLNGERVKPVKCDYFYVAKESFFKGAATLVFVALGSQYKGYAHEAESGQACPVTGENKAGSDVEESGVSEGINRTGMAAGLGLLVSQAKGEITGKKCVFKLNKAQSQKLNEKKGEVAIDLANEDANLQETIDLPLR